MTAKLSSVCENNEKLIFNFFSELCCSDCVQIKTFSYAQMGIMLHLIILLETAKFNATPSNLQRSIASLK